MKKIFAILTFWALAGMASCSNEPENVTPNEGAMKYELAIATDETRVEYNGGGEDGNTHKYRWEKGDDLAVWYSVNGADSYSAIEKPFVASIVEAGKPVVFFTDATSHDQMTKGQTYDYIAMYPYPTSVEGATATYTIGTATAEGAYVQNKGYESEYQILRAEGADKIAMSEGRPTLSDYKHMMTTLQFYVNSENSKGAYTDIEITELQIFFPENVTGVLTIDAKTGEITGATSDRIDVDMTTNAMGAYETRQAARQADDYVNVVCKPFTMQAYNTAAPAENRIVVNVIGKGFNVTAKATETISQSIFKTVSAEKTFAAADVIAMRLDLTDEWEQVEIGGEDNPLPTFSHKWTSGMNSAATNGNFGIYQGSVANNMVTLTNYYKLVLEYQTSASAFLVDLSALTSMNSEYNSTLIVEFDACVIVTEDDQPLPMIVSTNEDTGVGVFSELFGSNGLALTTVYLSNSDSNVALYKSADWDVDYPTTNLVWKTYSVTLRDFTTPKYLIFQIDGSESFNSDHSACYLKNIKFSYQQN